MHEKEILSYLRLSLASDDALQVKVCVPIISIPWYFDSKEKPLVFKAVYANVHLREGLRTSFRTLFS